MVNSSSQRLITIFLQEARERTSSIERDLLSLEKGTEEQSEEEEECVRNVLRSAHSLKGAARLVELHDLESVCHWMEELLTRSEACGSPLKIAHIKLLLKASDALAATLPILKQGNQPPPGPLEEVSAELLAASKDLSAISEIDAPQTAPAVEQIASQARHQDRIRPIESTFVPEAIESDPFLRVASERLDVILAHSGELLLARSAAFDRITQLSRVWDIVRRSQTEMPSGLKRELELEIRLLLSAMTADSRALKRISVGLDAEVRDARLQPFDLVCEGLERLVRDLANVAGKKVRLEIEGGEIEIDRSILDEVRTAIRHLVRNAVDHGIESPVERVAAGKSAEGRVLISVSLQQDRIVIAIRDDGRGLARDRIRTAAEQSGLGQTLADEDVESLIFRSGISTATTATRVSGRGVGLDAVKRCVENLRGTIQVECSGGEGATFTIILPLTVGSMRALLVRCGGQTFAIESSAVRRVFRFSPKMISASGAGQLVVCFESPLPFVRLADWLQIASEKAAGPASQLVGIELAEVGRGVAVEVDGIVAEQEFLIRSLGPRLSNVQKFSGAIVMPDGGVALVLNVAAVGLAALTGEIKPLINLETRSDAKRHKVLIVDDSITTRTLEKTILEGAGYQVTVAADGIEAWRVLEEEGGDLVLADVDMPGMDGFALTEKVRHSAQFRDLPIILLTARESPHDRERGLSVGADAYLVKSAFDQRELIRTIGQLL